MTDHIKARILPIFATAYHWSVLALLPIQISITLTSPVLWDFNEILLLLHSTSRRTSPFLLSSYEFQGNLRQCSWKRFNSLHSRYKSHNRLNWNELIFLLNQAFEPSQWHGLFSVTLVSLHLNILTTWNWGNLSRKNFSFKRSQMELSASTHFSSSADFWCPSSTSERMRKESWKSCQKVWTNSQLELSILLVCLSIDLFVWLHHTCMCWELWKLRWNILQATLFLSLQRLIM